MNTYLVLAEECLARNVVFVSQRMVLLGVGLAALLVTIRARPYGFLLLGVAAVFHASRSNYNCNWQY